MEKRCANCCTAFKTNLSRFTVIPWSPDADTGMREVPVAEALATVFNKKNKAEFRIEDVDIGVCLSCYQDLRTLYTHHKAFTRRQHFSSLTALIREKKDKSTQTVELGLVPPPMKMEQDSSGDELAQNYVDTVMEDSDGDNQSSSPPRKKRKNPVKEFHTYVKSPKSEEYQNSDSNISLTHEQENKETEAGSKVTKYRRYNEKKMAGIDTLVRPAVSYPPTQEEILKYRLTTLEPPFTCPTCQQICPSYLHYKEHVKNQHLHNKLFRCSIVRATVVNPKTKCRFNTWEFAAYRKHCLSCHSFRPEEAAEQRDARERDLVLGLLPLTEDPAVMASNWASAELPNVNKLKKLFFTQPGQPEPPFECGKCLLDQPVTFPNKEMYLLHMWLNNHESRAIKCDKCDRQYLGKTYETRFLTHYSDIHGVTADLATYPKTVVTLSYDETTLGHFGLWPRMITELVGNPPYTCFVCLKNKDKEKDQGQNEGQGQGQAQLDRTYKRVTELWSHHQETHFTPKNYPCVKCEESFTSLHLWRTHVARFCATGRLRKIRKERFKPPFICTECPSPGPEFPSRQKLTGHRRAVHQVSTAVFTCENCGKQYNTMGKLNSHRRTTHSTERPFICEQCGKSYKSSGHLTMHVRIAHTEEGRLAYNEYTRLKNQRRKLRDSQSQKEGGGRTEEQEEAEEQEEDGEQDEDEEQEEEDEEEEEQDDYIEEMADDDNH